MKTMTPNKARVIVAWWIEKGKCRSFIHSTDGVVSTFKVTDKLSGVVIVAGSMKDLAVKIAGLIE